MLLGVLFYKMPLTFVTPKTNSNLTEGFPQYYKNWYKNDPSTYMLNFASPGFGSQYFSANLRVYGFVTDMDYMIHLEYLIANFPVDIEQEWVTSLPDDADLHDMFDYISRLRLDEWDFLFLPFQLPEQEVENDIRMHMSLFYDPERRAQRYYFPIKTVQYVFEHYNEYFIKEMLEPYEYYDMYAQKVILYPTQILTTAFDQLDTLALNAQQICHVSPNYNIQTNSHLCQFALPFGMGTRGFNGTGTVGDALVLAMQLVGQVSMLNLSLYDRISIIKQSIKHRPQAFIGNAASASKQQPGIGFGVPSAKALKEEIDDIDIEQTIKYDEEVVILTKNDLGQMATFDVGNVEVYRIFITMRGDHDEYQPLYKFMAQTHFSEKESLKQYDGISIYVCERFGMRIKPMLIGTLSHATAENSESDYRFILEQNNLWNIRLSGKLSLLFTYDSDQNRVSEQINEDGFKPIATNLRVALTIACKLNSVNVTMITHIDKLYYNSLIRFETNASFVYSQCFNTEMIYREYTFPANEPQSIKTILADSIGECVLYFCGEAKRNTETLLLTDDCVSSEVFTVQRKFLATGFLVLFLFACLFVIVLLLMPSVQLKIVSE